MFRSESSRATVLTVCSQYEISPRLLIKFRPRLLYSQLLCLDLNVPNGYASRSFIHVFLCVLKLLTLYRNKALSTNLFQLLLFKTSVSRYCLRHYNSLSHCSQLQHLLVQHRKQSFLIISLLQSFLQCSMMSFRWRCYLRIESKLARKFYSQPSL